MNISIASYSFHGLVETGRMDVFGYLECCRYRYQIAAADIWSGMIPTLDRPFLAKLKDELAERELTLANLCVDGPHVWEDDPAARENHHRQALEWLEAAEYLGARTLRIDAGGKGESWTSEQFDEIALRFREFAQRARDAGFKVGPENHWGPEVVPSNMRRLAEAVNHPGFGVLLHYKREDLDQFSRWAMHTHLAWDIVMNDLETHLDLLRKEGYSGYWGVEHHSGKHEYAEVAIQVARVRDALLKGS